MMTLVEEVICAWSARSKIAKLGKARSSKRFVRVEV
jgi:hypothetical protein